MKAKHNFLLLDRIDNKPKNVIQNPNAVDSRWYKINAAGPGMFSSQSKRITLDVNEGDTVYMANHGVKSFISKDSNKVIYGASALDVVGQWDGETFHPRGNYVRIKLLKLNHDIKYTEDNLNLDWWAEVLEVGPGLKNEQNEYLPIELEVGETIMFIPFRMMKINYEHLGINKEPEFLVDYSEIVGTL